jgi:hypothetical protein
MIHQAKALIACVSDYRGNTRDPTTDGGRETTKANSLVLLQQSVR